jgi:hypothetical protein
MITISRHSNAYIYIRHILGDMQRQQQQQQQTLTRHVKNDDDHDDDDKHQCKKKAAVSLLPLLEYIAPIVANKQAGK